MLVKTNCYHVMGIPLLIRETDANDALTVTMWRNQESARIAFYHKEVVTPDTHRAFLLEKKSHDLIFIAEYKDFPIGMFSLTIEPENYIAECGRMYVDEDYRGRGFGAMLDFLQLHMAFEFFRLNSVWGEIYVDNEKRKNLAEATGWVVREISLEGVATVTYDKETWQRMKPELEKKWK